ncbi:MAG: helix-turn-helix domain-containing protein [Patescibacteria group bacterium]
MDKELVSVLGNVGFTEKEAQVYIALLSLGAGTVQQIATLSGLKRPIIYVVLEGLIQRGYASAVPGKKIHTFQAIEAGSVLHRLQADITHFTQYLPIFKTLGNRGASRPKISYHDTEEGILNVYEGINYSADPLFITSYTRLNAHFPGIVERWIKNYKKGLYKKMHGMHIVPDTEEELGHARDFIQIHQQVRIWSALRGAQMDFSIYENKLAITSLGEKPFVVVIESADIVQSLRPIFDVVWENAKEIK